MSCARVLILLVLTVCCFLSPSNGKLLKFVRLTDAPQTHGARCLDGSPPGFYFRAGVGSGRTKWIVHLSGGGWCFNEADCLGRATTQFGSLHFGSTNTFTMDGAAREAGFLSDVKILNPDFYNWNMAFVAYCDGGLFAGHREDPLVVNGTTLHFRGFRNLQAIMDALMTMGMRRATDVILTGCSAGGVSTYIHADYVKSLLPPGVKYAAMADAGIYDVSPGGSLSLIGAFNLHNMTEQLDEDCVKMFAPINEAWRCLFVEHQFPHISSPLFAYNSIYDPAALSLSYGCLTPDCAGLDVNLGEILSDYKEEFFNATADIRSREDVGVFFDSCLRHCQSTDDTWFRGVMVEGQSPRETFANWYFGREGGKTKVVDCEEYPCNDSCGTPRDLFGNDYPFPEANN